MDDDRPQTRGVSQADMLAAILREFPGWANRAMAVPHLMKFLKGVGDRGVELRTYGVEAEAAGENGRTWACLLASVGGIDADGVERTFVLDLAGRYGVVGREVVASAQCSVLSAGKWPSGQVAKWPSDSAPSALCHSATLPLRHSSAAAAPAAECRGTRTYTSEKTAAEFAGIGVPADAKWAKGPAGGGA